MERFVRTALAGVLLVMVPGVAHASFQEVFLGTYGVMLALPILLVSALVSSGCRKGLRRVALVRHGWLFVICMAYFKTIVWYFEPDGLPKPKPNQSTLETSNNEILSSSLVVVHHVGNPVLLVLLLLATAYLVLSYHKAARTLRTQPHNSCTGVFYAATAGLWLSASVVFASTAFTLNTSIWSVQRNVDYQLEETSYFTAYLWHAFQLGSWT